jgi:hypothetical protein
LRDRLEPDLRDRLDDDLRERLEPDLRDRLDDDLRERLEPDLRERLDEERPLVGRRRDDEPEDERERDRVEPPLRERERLPELEPRLGTLPPSRRASDSPIAIACFRLLTFLPDPPDRSVPRLRSCMAFSTLLEAFFPYLRPPDLRCANGHLLASSMTASLGPDRARGTLVAPRFRGGNHCLGPPRTP